jgi:hypothetical protein
VFAFSSLNSLPLFVPKNNLLVVYGDTLKLVNETVELPNFAVENCMDELVDDELALIHLRTWLTGPLLQYMIFCASS